MARYEELVAAVAHANRPEIAADLARARADVARACEILKEAQDRVAAFSALLALADRYEGIPSQSSSRITLHETMAEVLKGAPERMMRPAHLAEEIERRGLYRMRDVPQFRRPKNFGAKWPTDRNRMGRLSSLRSWGNGSRR